MIDPATTTTTTTTNNNPHHHHQQYHSGIAACDNNHHHHHHHNNNNNNNGNDVSIPHVGFEGPEKRLEIEFAPAANSGNSRGLCRVSAQQWQELVLDKAQCTIISTTVNEHFNSYVLSESSLFVYPNKVMIKTCGTTVLLNAVQPILEIAQSMDMTVQFVMYSRKNFVFPDAQPAPHRSFDEEMRHLDRFFDGTGYVIGPLNGDHWNLYVADYTTDSTRQQMQQQRRQALRKKHHGDRTILEVMMHDLAPHKMQQFFRDSNFVSAEQTTALSGIGSILPGSKIDAFMFDPCGYSMNGLLDDAYWTIHITPEDGFSFVSFETNVSPDQIKYGGSYAKLVEKVVDVFAPGRFTVTLFADDKALRTKTYEELKGFTWNTYRMKSKSNTEFVDGYNLTCAQYVHLHNPRFRNSNKMRRCWSAMDTVRMHVSLGDDLCNNKNNNVVDSNSSMMETENISDSSDSEDDVASRGFCKSGNAVVGGFPKNLMHSQSMITMNCGGDL